MAERTLKRISKALNEHGILSTLRTLPFGNYFDGEEQGIYVQGLRVVLDTHLDDKVSEKMKYIWSLEEKYKSYDFKESGNGAWYCFVIMTKKDRKRADLATRKQQVFEDAFWQYIHDHYSNPHKGDYAVNAGHEALRKEGLL